VLTVAAVVFAAARTVPAVGNGPNMVDFANGSGSFQTFTANGSAVWNNVGTAPAPSNGEEVISVDVSNGTAHVVFNGKTIDVPVAQPHLGIAANNTTGHFTALSWQ